MKKNCKVFFFIGIGFGFMIASLLGLINNKIMMEQNKSTFNQEESIPKNEVQKEYVVINITKGESTDEIAQELFENRIIYDKEKFIYILDLLDIYGKIPEGEKKITKGQPVLETINELIK